MYDHVSIFFCEIIPAKCRKQFNSVKHAILNQGRQIFNGDLGGLALNPQSIKE
jgi:hypothetical protein